MISSDDSKSQNNIDKINTPKPADADTMSKSSDTSLDKKSASESTFSRQISGVKLPPETQEFLNSRRIAANFGNIVTVLMQSPSHKDRKLSELRNLVVPALVNNQFRVAEAHSKGSGFTVPVGVILWARVSDDVDQKLSSVSNGEIDLSASDWTGGDNIWIIEAVGQQRFVTSLFKDLHQKDFKDKKVKYRRRTAKGFEVMTLP